MHAPQGSQWQRNINPWVAVGIIAAIFVSAAIAAALHPSDPERIAAPPAPPPPAAVPAPIRVRVLELCDSYDANEVAGDTQYKSHQLLIYGRVLSVSRSLDGGSTVEVGSSPEETVAALRAAQSATGDASAFKTAKREFERIRDAEVECSFDQSMDNAVAKLGRGQAITVRGTVARFLLRPRLESCSIQTNP